MGNQQQVEEKEDDFNKKDLIDDVMMTSDMFYPSAKPSDITGQSLAVTMETDKSKVLSSMLIPTIHTPMLAQDHVSNVIKPATVAIAAPHKTVQASKSIGVEETQEVIEEIQDFLDQFTDEGMEQNDEIKELEGSADTGYSSSNQASINVSNVSEIITEDGQNIIIVIAPSPSEDLKHHQILAPTTPNNQVLASLNVPVSTDTSYQPSELSDDESNTSGEDSDWVPDAASANVRYKSKADTTITKEQAREKVASSYHINDIYCLEYREST